ncbi:MAG TPA: tetratricopeptide repeat protein [Kofleriaceae bacterium]
MRKLVGCAVVLAVACNSDPKQTPKPAPVAPAPVAASGSAAATASGSAAVAAKPARPALTKQQLLDVRKHMKAGWAAQKAKRWSDAVVSFEAALKIADGDPRLLTELGWSAMNAGDYAKAKRADEQSVHAATDNKIKAAGLYNLGLVQLKLNDAASARASFATSLELRPNKTVEAALAKLGAPTANEDLDACPVGKSACYCAVSAEISSPEDEDLAGCHESTVTKSPVPGWKVYTIDTGHGTAEELLDEHNQVITQLGADDSRLNHVGSITLDKAEIKTVGGHRVVRIEVTDSVMTQTMDDETVTDESADQTTVTICTIGDTKTPSHCAIRDAPMSTVNSTNRYVMLDDGTIKDRGKQERTETTLDIAIADDGTVTVKLVKGSADVVPPSVLGPHKLW